MIRSSSLALSWRKLRCVLVDRAVSGTTVLNLYGGQQSIICVITKDRKVMAIPKLNTLTDETSSGGISYRRFGKASRTNGLAF